MLQIWLMQPKNKNIEAGKNNPKKVNDNIIKAWKACIQLKGIMNLKKRLSLFKFLKI